MRAAALITVFTSVLAAPALAVPAPAHPPSSVLHSAQPPGPPLAPMPLSPVDMPKIVRLTEMVNAMYCPLTRAERTEDTSQIRLGVQQPQVLVSSRDPGRTVEGAPSMSWHISHSPAEQVLTVILSSLSSSALLVSALTQPAPSAEVMPPFLPLPRYLFPSVAHSRAQPRVYTAFLPALETHGAAVLASVRDILADQSVVRNRAAAGRKPVLSTEPESITRVEVVGHGLGAAVALLVAAALRADAIENRGSVQIEATFFSLPRVGDAGFGRWLESLVDSGGRGRFTLHHVTSNGDPIPHLPAVPNGLSLLHPRAITEVFVGGNPQDVYFCEPEGDA